MGTQLQDILNEFGCSILNYTKNKLYVEHFYSEERYNDFLHGRNCRGGQGLFDEDEVLIFNKLEDNVLVILQNDGVETARYRYKPIFKATMEYKYKESDGKKINRYLTFIVRREEFKGTINFIAEIDEIKTSLDFYNTEQIKDYLNEKFGTNKLTDWSVVIG